MPTESSKDFASEYFANLNPIASKISLDINETKSSYEHIWNQLTPVEQIDIINETLIKPEIALKYFDNLSASSSGLLATSDDNDYLPSDGEIKKKFCDKLLSTKNIYSYDFKNLLTYSIQKTGLKLIHDDAIGAFRDEHSMPFSYKTKSQINLRIFSDCNLNHKSDMLQSQDAVQFNLGKYHSNKVDNVMTNNCNKTKLSSQLTQAALQSNHQTAQNAFDKTDTGKYERYYNEEILKADINNMHPNKLFSDNVTEIDDNKSNFLSKFICKNNLIFNAGTNLLVKNRQSDGDEILNLMKNVSYGGLTSSSSVPSEEEEDKQLCEDSRLLLENDELRKGFDFLNNW